MRARSGQGPRATPSSPPVSPERPKTRRQRWGWVLITGAVLVAFAGALGVLSIGLWRYANHDSVGLVDDPRISSTADSACSAMTRAVQEAASPPGATDAVRVRAIREQNTAVAAMIRTIRALGVDRLANDHPMLLWLADWQTLVDRRARYADSLASGRHVPFVVPAADGRPITDRLNQVGLACTVPAQLTDLR